ncbi:hypothetical protein GTP81_06420 [Rugamonas sp. FT107W]|uniref:Uncharacterized protein n=1 Tax=Duganella vulcania TaxID=2692166 RepID=A0A845HGA1_9BURK|nr:hypothetical protein [Duganella vulcania]MYN16383.1 hypothetical protein [Duganella vulcania]
MRKPNKWWLLLFVPVILVALPIGVLYWSAFDNTEKIVHALLFRANGDLDEKIFLAAMTGRFPKGTEVRELIAFITAFKGQCKAGSNDKLNCSLDVSGAFCVATKMQIDVKTTADGKIEEFNAVEYFIGC